MPPATFSASASTAHAPTPPLWQLVLRSLPVPVLMSVICWVGAGVNYLLFHTLAELFSIVIAMVALVVATTSQRFTRNHFVVYIAVAIGWCGALDLLHMVVLDGMQLLPGNSADPAIQLWVAARFIQAVALVSAPLLLYRSVRPLLMQAGFGMAAVLSAALIANDFFPAAYVDGQGLTPFKIYAEYVIIGLLTGALALLWRQRALMSTRLLANLMAAGGVHDLVRTGLYPLCERVRNSQPGRASAQDLCVLVRLPGTGAQHPA